MTSDLSFRAAGPYYFSETDRVWFTPSAEDSSAVILMPSGATSTGDAYGTLSSTRSGACLARDSRIITAACGLALSRARRLVRPQALRRGGAGHGRGAPVSAGAGRGA